MAPTRAAHRVLFLLASARAESFWSGSWLGRQLTSGLNRLTHAATELGTARSAAQSLQVDGEPLTLEELEMPLLGARLAMLAYVESQWELESGLRDAAAKWQMHERIDGSRLQLVRFEPQRVSTPAPQWYLARSADALFVVFRGTYSVFDVLHDLMASPEPAAEGADSFHGGFLSAVREVAGGVRDALVAELRRADASYARIYLIGHSLGGALALTLLGAGLLPAAPDGGRLRSVPVWRRGASLPALPVADFGPSAAERPRRHTGAHTRGPSVACAAPGRMPRTPPRAGCPP